MSVVACIAVKVQMDQLSRLMDRNKHLSLEDQLKEIRKWISETRQAADSGWL